MFDEEKWKKGNSLLEFPSDYTVVDLETTGLEPYCDEIIEVACIKYRNNTEVARFESLVQPTPYREYLDDDEDEPTGELRYVDDFIVSLTGITNEMLATAPQFDAIAEDLYKFLDGETLIGHNVNFDVRFLLETFRWKCQLPFKNNFVDTLRLSRWILPELKHHTLADLVKYYNLTGTQHRAMQDCEFTQQIYRNLNTKAVETNFEFKFKKGNPLDLRTLKCENPEPDTSGLFYGKNCVFTGELERFTRKEAAQIVVNAGGICQNGITKKTNFLIIGSMTALNIKDGKSNKMVKAEKLKQKGQDIHIISENTFYELITEEDAQ